MRYLPSSGLRIESADGNFALAPGAWLQTLYTLLDALPLDATLRYGQVRGTGSSRLADSDELGAGIAWNAGARRFRVQAD